MKNIFKRNKDVNVKTVDLTQKISAEFYESEACNAKKVYEAALRRKDCIIYMLDNLPNYVVPQGHKVLFEDNGVSIAKIIKKLPARVDLGELFEREILDSKSFCFEYKPVNIANLIYAHEPRKGSNQVEAITLFNMNADEDFIENKNMAVLSIAIVADNNYLNAGVPMTYLLASRIDSCNSSRTLELEKLVDSKISTNNLYLISLNKIKDYLILKKI